MITITKYCRTCKQKTEGYVWSEYHDDTRIKIIHEICFECQDDYNAERPKTDLKDALVPSLREDFQTVISAPYPKPFTVKSGDVVESHVVITDFGDEKTEPRGYSVVDKVTHGEKDVTKERLAGIV